MGYPTIWKYPIHEHKHQFIPMPKGAEILSVQMQGKTVQLWALVDPDAEEEQRYFELYGTGWEIIGGREGLKFIGTFQPNEGGSPLVFHLFERLPR